MKTRIVAWWSGGITSAVACHWAIQTFKNVAIVFLDTKKNEDEDTYRFLTDCQKLYGQEIEVLSNPEYKTIQDVWRKFKSLNTAHGAICSTELKRKMREGYQNLDTDYSQVFGFEFTKKEIRRHFQMRKNYPEINMMSPNIENKMNKRDCIKHFTDLGIKPPQAYKLGYHNNNCLKTGCVQGGIGYWQKRMIEAPESFEAMAAMEHELTDVKGEPVTILKDQSKNGGLVFLKPHPKYPHMKDITMMKGRKVISLMECTGFCSTR